MRRAVTNTAAALISSCLRRIAVAASNDLAKLHAQTKRNPPRRHIRRVEHTAAITVEQYREFYLGEQ